MRFHSSFRAVLPLLFLALAAAVGWNSVGARSVETGLELPPPPPPMQGLPFYFEANQGQTDERVAFLARARGYTAFVEPNRLTLGVGKGRAAAVTMRFVGADPEAAVRGVDELPGKVNYFKGRGPESWRTKVPTFDRVRVDEAYPGIDIVYYGVGRQAAFDAVVAPGADPAALQLTFDGAAGVEIDEQGDLIVDIGIGKLRLPRPLVYQEDTGQRAHLAGRYAIENSHVRIDLDSYDRARPLIIDPVLDLVHSTFYGAAQNDTGTDIAVDGAGQIYVAGETNSADFPTVNAVQPDFGGGLNSGDAFMLKLTADGSTVVYASFLGGEGNDWAEAVQASSAGEAYVVGRAQSDDFPVVNPLQASYSGNADGFIAKLSPGGSTLEYSTYLGGTEADAVNAIAVDSSGSVYLAGFTLSADFPTSNPIQEKQGESADAFVAKLNPAGSGLLYSTFLGGSEIDNTQGIAIDIGGNAYVMGKTESPDFPTVQPLQPSLAGNEDLFVSKLGPTGATLLYSTYLGGTDREAGSGGIAVDTEGSAYIVDNTRSADFPTANALQPEFAGGETDIVVAKVAPDGTTLTYSTFLGGLGDDWAGDIAVDATGHAYITGFTQSPNFPTTNAWQPSYGGGLREMYLSKLTPTGSALVFSTFFGGTTDDFADGIALGPDDLDVYIAGESERPGDFPTLNPIQSEHGGEKDIAIARFTQVLQPQVRLQPFVVRFGVVPVGAPKVRRFFAFNDGDLPLTINQIDGLEPPFGLLWPQLPFTLQPGEVSPVFVGWQPTSPGPLVQPVPVTSNDPDDPVKGVLLRGAAVNAASQEGKKE